MRKLGIGIIGCGVISDIYCKNAPRFADIEMRACADIRPDAAEAKAKAYGLEALSIQDLLDSPDVDIVLNLTVPNAHVEVSRQALEAGKHVYSEKPLGTQLAGARELVELAEREGLRLASAPDTILGAGGREARKIIDGGKVGQITAGTAFVMSRGMEHWHPNPGFFFQAGAGPVFDLGPYYLSQLVNLLGPVKTVAALAGMGFPERLVTAPGAMEGKTIPVETPTTLLSLLEFQAGPLVVFGASWDVSRHGHLPFELYGTLGSLRVPDPNFMGGTLAFGTREQDWETLSTAELTFGRLNWPADAPRAANDRGLGLAEMGRAIKEGRPQRLSPHLALHVTSVMAAILEAGTARRVVEVTDRCERPALLDEEEAQSLLA